MHILAIDQGTTSSRAAVVDQLGRIVAMGQVQLTQHYPAPGLVEHDAAEIWRSTLSAIGQALAASGLNPRDLAAIGITNQRETVVAWDRTTGEPLAPAIVWQDRRTAARCEALRAQGREDEVAATTGLTLDPYFSATKLESLLTSSPAVATAASSRTLALGTVDSWLLWNLTGGRQHVTDETNASRTMLFDIEHGRWDDRLLQTFGVPRAALPQVLPSIAEFGLTDAGVFGSQVPIRGIAGDQQAALLGQACFAPGQAKNTYGTGAFLLAHAGTRRPFSKHRLLTSIAAGRGSPRGYVIEGSVFVAGALVRWLRDGAGIIEATGDIEALAASVPDSGGVVIVPAFTGLGAPEWDASARGTIVGLTLGTGRAELARAALDAIALSSAELLRLVAADLDTPLDELRVDGGASRNDLLMQLQADYAGVPVVRPREIESTALGAAFLAGLGAGIWQDEGEVATLVAVERRFEPRLSATDREAHLARWRRAVERARGWAE